MGYKKSCHNHKKPVFKKGNLSIFGGAYSEINYWNYDAVIRLIETPYGSSLISGTGIFKDFVKRVDKGENILHLPIRDMSVPDYSEDMWVSLVGLLLENSKEKEFKVAVHCLGGHGRTGLVLAIIGMLLKQLPTNAIDMVDELRKRYCKKAIESKKQLEYVYKIGKNLELLDELDKDELKEYLKLTTKTTAIYYTPRDYKGYSNNWSDEDYFITDDETDNETLDLEGKTCKECKYRSQCPVEDDDTPIMYGCNDFTPKDGHSSEEILEEAEEKCEACAHFQDCPYPVNEYTYAKDFNCKFYE